MVTGSQCMNCIATKDDTDFSDSEILELAGKSQCYGAYDVSSAVGCHYVYGPDNKRSNADEILRTLEVIG